MKETLIKENGIMGVLYGPNQTYEKLPGIILLSGSDGGIPGNNAIPINFIEQLVTNGFIVLSLAYFGVEGLPPYLENIELEYFELAFEWFKSHIEVRSDAIIIVGQSRGAELALILGTILRPVKAIVAYAPSSLITGGFPHPNLPAWKYRNTTLAPYLGGLSSNDTQLTELDDLNQAIHENLIPAHANTELDPFIISDLFFARNLTEHAKFAVIPVEKITCPILLFSGRKDAIWTSTYYCESIINRLRAYHSCISYKHIDYENAGHGLIASYEGSIYHPVGKFWCKLGGTLEGNQIANQDSLKKTIAFLLSIVAN